MFKVIGFFIIGIPLAIWGILSLWGALNLALSESSDNASFIGSLFGMSILPLILTLFGLALIYAGKNALDDVKAEKDGTSEGFKDITK